jgi:DNA-binding transcriptional regulator of glucitol operon
MSDPMPIEPKKNRTGLIIAVVVIVLCCCCLVVAGIGWSFGDSILQLFNGGSSY